MDRIKVFISSAMSKQPTDSIEWLAVRKAIADELNEAILFDTFTIEEHASPDSSNQYMLAQVSECDVYVLVLGAEIRYGTEQEYRRARELRKDMLVYVVNVAHNENCRAVIEELQNEDRCLYCKVKTVDGLEKQILRDLFEIVTRRYKGLSQLPRLEVSSRSERDSAFSSDVVLKGFGQSSLTLGGRLGYEYDPHGGLADDAPLQQLGEQLIDWLMGGRRPELKNLYVELEEVLGVDEAHSSESDVFHLRWGAFEAYVNGHLDTAVKLLEDAASKVEDNSHLITGILIDLRNVASEKDGLGAMFKYQKEIDLRGSKYYMPDGFEFSIRSDSTMQAAQDAEWLTPERTMVFGECRLASALVNISNKLFASVLYGSIASAVSCRVELAKTLMRFSRIYGDRALYVEGLRLLVLANDAKDLEEWLNAGFDFANQELVSHAGELWDAAVPTPGSAANACGLIVLRELGSYLDNGRFQQACIALLDLSRGLWLVDRLKYGRALSANAHRMTPGLLIPSICAMLSDCEYQSMDCIHRCLEDLRIEDASIEEQAQLADVLERCYPRLVKEGFSSSIIAALARKSGPIAHLGPVFKSQLEKDELMEFEINERGGQVTSEYCASLVDDALSQLVANDNPGFQTEFAARPARYLARIMSADLYSRLRNEVEPRLFEVMDYVAHSGAPGMVLDDYVMLFTKMTVVYRKLDYPMPIEFKRLARALLKKRPQIDAALTHYERRAWNARVSTYCLLCGLGRKTDFLRTITDVRVAGISAREAIAECLEAYLEVFGSTGFRDVVTIAIVLDNLSRDKDAKVRLIAERCAMRLCGTSVDYEATDVLLRLSRDPRPSVRYGFIEYGPKHLKDSDLLREIITYLQGDAHYEIRRAAFEMLLRMDGSYLEDLGH